MRVVLDPNVLVSAAISTAGPPRQIVAALARPKFRRWISAAVARELIDGRADAALIIDDPPGQPDV